MNDTRSCRVMPCTAWDKQYKTMKKNLIYTVAFLLCGTFFFSSCEDMLNVESNRVEYEFDDWSLNDSVYSVLGILKSVQEVGDRQVLLNELRADLVSISETKAVLDVQEISKSILTNFDANKYLDVKDYYSIINNCNIYLARVDTTLRKNNIPLMLPEYVAVKSVRAWTYLQLAINYNNVPYFTEPILTHSAASKVMSKPMLTRNEIVSNLIADILPYENPAAFPMPAWDKDGKVLKFGYGENGTEVDTKQLFVPIRMLLGELYLWRGAAGDYKRAAECFYNQITGAGTNNKAPKYTDNKYKVSYTQKNGKGFNNNYAPVFAAKSFATNASSILALIPYANSDLHGTMSGLSSVFSPENDPGGAQVFASQGMISLAKRQIYRYVEYEGDDIERPTHEEYSHKYEYPGDLRIKATTYSQIGNDDRQTEYDNVIAKFNLEENSLGSIKANYVPRIRTTYIPLMRAELAYLRLAEALVGMEREGYTGAASLAMTILKSGVKKNYTLLKDPVYESRPELNSRGDTIKIYEIDKSTGDTLSVTNKMRDYLVSYTDSLGYNFTDETFEANKGIHARGTGDAERNIYYDLDSVCVARYIGAIEENGSEIKITRALTREDFLNYITDLVIDELALEFAWEGFRFGDLVRFAKATGDNDILAKRIAGRAISNDVTYRNEAFQYDSELYGKMLNEENWYLPLPGEVVEPVAPDEVPGGTLPEENE